MSSRSCTNVALTIACFRFCSLSSLVRDESILQMKKKISRSFNCQNLKFIIYTSQIVLTCRKPYSSLLLHATHQSNNLLLYIYSVLRTMLLSTEYTGLSYWTRIIVIKHELMFSERIVLKIALKLNIDIGHEYNNSFYEILWWVR